MQSSLRMLLVPSLVVSCSPQPKGSSESETSAGTESSDDASDEAEAGDSADESSTDALPDIESDYAFAQHLATYFLGAQRCGDTESWIHPEKGCHMSDGENEGVDLSGGWHDCGDYIKFQVTAPTAAAVMLYGYDRYPEAYGDHYSQALSAPPANGIPDILDEVKIQTDFMIRAIDGDRIYWQVGGKEDHNSFSDPVTNSSEPLYDGSHIRPVYAAESGHSNVFGSSAAALALMSIAYRPFDADYADACLEAAKVYYKVGRINPAATAAVGAYEFMKDTDYADEMGLGAVMLHRATEDTSYLDDALDYAKTPWRDRSFSYPSVSPLLALELYWITEERSHLEDVARVVDRYALASCGYEHTTNWGSLRNATYNAMLAALYHQASGDSDAYDYAKATVDFVLGDHEGFANVPANFSFLIGYDRAGGKYPRSPHHAAAFGKSNNAWGLFGEERDDPGSVEFRYELRGGLAGGPEQECGEFEDNIGNYVSSEYCAYYNAGFIGASAYIYMEEDM